MALAAGTAIGVTAMTLFFVAVNARYALVNRALAKKLRQREPPRGGG